MPNGMDKITILRLASAAFLVLAAIAVFFVSYVRPTPYVAISTQKEFRGATVQVESRGKTVVLDRHGGRVFEKPEGVDGSYILSAAIGDGDDIHDIVLRVDDTKKTVSLQAGGFTPGGALDLQNDGKKILSDLHFDWAGRIALTHDFKGQKGGPLCLETESGFSFCHLLPDGGRA